jgi:outer membrane lipoprotein LolB
MSWRAVALVGALALGGCTTMTRPTTIPDEAAWSARRAELGALARWQLEGKVAIAAGPDSWSGSLTWEQEGERLEFRFSGPFGIGGLRIWGGPGALQVRTHKGETFTIVDPERDLEERLGWSVPVLSMRYWMVGVPAPGAAAEARVDGAGRASELVQQGWTVRYAEYQEVGALELPRRFTIERDRVRIKVAADRWTLAAGGAPSAAPDAFGDELDL